MFRGGLEPPPEITPEKCLTKTTLHKVRGSTPLTLYVKRVELLHQRRFIADQGIMSHLPSVIEQKSVIGNDAASVVLHETQKSCSLLRTGTYPCSVSERLRIASNGQRTFNSEHSTANYKGAERPNSTYLGNSLCYLGKSGNI